MPFSKCDLPQGTVEYFEKGIKILKRFLMSFAEMRPTTGYC